MQLPQLRQRNQLCRHQHLRVLLRRDPQLLGRRWCGQRSQHGLLHRKEHLCSLRSPHKGQQLPPLRRVRVLPNRPVARPLRKEFLRGPPLVLAREREPVYHRASLGMELRSARAQPQRRDKRVQLLPQDRVRHLRGSRSGRVEFDRPDLEHHDPAFPVVLDREAQGGRDQQDQAWRAFRKQSLASRFTRENRLPLRNAAGR